MIDDQPNRGDVDYDPASMATSSLSTQRAVWYKRPWFLIAFVIAVVIGVSIITDLPHHISVSEDATAQNASLKQINHDIAPCAYAVTEAFRFYRQNLASPLSPGRLKVVNTYLTNDQTVCSFASAGMSDLTNNLQVLDTSGGKYIDKLLSVSVIWMDSDANGAIFDVQRLLARPNDAKTLRDLTKREDYLAADRQKALADLATAEALVGAPLHTLNLPVLDRLPGT